jgi:hypothetical protein
VKGGVTGRNYLFILKFLYKQFLIKLAFTTGKYLSFILTPHSHFLHNRRKMLSHNNRSTNMSEKELKIKRLSEIRDAYKRHMMTPQEKKAENDKEMNDLFAKLGGQCQVPS